MAEETGREAGTIGDRKLGDEWADWSGDSSEYEARIVEGKTKFVVFSFVLYLAVSACAFATLYLVSPRLAQFWTHLPSVALAVVLAGVGAALLWYLLFVLSLVLSRNMLPASGKVGSSIAFFGPKVIWLGQKFGISRDRMGSSFVKVCNLLVKVSGARRRKGDVLVLLPRCLSKETRPKIVEICDKYGCKVETVAGGEAARAAVKRIMPRGIVGVACERDLVSGLKDVVSRFPAVGVPNTREEGPCKNTSIDLAEFEEAVRIFFPENGRPPAETPGNPGVPTRCDPEERSLEK